MIDWDYSVNLKQEIEMTNWWEIFRNKSVDKMVNSFTEKILEIAQKHIPSKTITVCDKDAPLANSCGQKCYI